MGNLVNDLTLAYLGDAVYSTFMRKEIILNQPLVRVDDAHRLANTLVSAKGQSKALLYLKDKNILTDEEWDIARKARNKSSATRAKNASIKEYRNATGIEALIGHLYLSDNEERIKALLKPIFEQEVHEWNQ